MIETKLCVIVCLINARKLEEPAAVNTTFDEIKEQLSKVVWVRAMSIHEIEGDAITTSTQKTVKGPTYQRLTQARS